MGIPKERLMLLEQVQKDLINGKRYFFPDQPKFGFVHFETLHHVDLEEEIKGYPCVAYNHPTDVVKFGVKVNPLERDYDEDQHPGRMEAKLLEEFTRCVLKKYTPHITFYFQDMDVSNSKSAITKFPLKSVQKHIFNCSSVLVSEFVNGGSIDDWVMKLEDMDQQPSLEQWRYIIFSMIWTLLVLQDRYHFVHRDFHVGNILIDDTLTEDDDTIWSYTLNLGKDTHSFHVPSCGILPKMWDFEFSNVFKTLNIPPSPLGCYGDSRPSEFNPYYDLHFFLMTLLEVCNLPEVEKFITSLYPPELIPDGLLCENDHGSDCSTCSSSSSSQVESFDSMIITHRTDGSHAGRKRSSSSDDSDDDDEWSIEYPHFEDLVYYTDEDISTIESDSTGSSSSHSNCSSTSSTSSDSSDVTPFLHKNRLRNHTHQVYKDLPTPLSVLSHPFFTCYRKLPRSGSKKRDVLSYHYKVTSPPHELL
jgi:hypothetical protein